MAIVERTKREDTGAERFEIHLGGIIYVLSLKEGERIARDILSLLDIEVAHLEDANEIYKEALKKITDWANNIRQLGVASTTSNHKQD